MPIITHELVRKTAQARTSSRLVEREKFINGDVWANGDGWPGGVPVGRFDSHTNAVAALKKAFAPIDAIGDVMSFHCDAVDGSWWVSLERSLKQDEKPTEGEQALIDEADALLTTWWDGRKAQTTLRSALGSLLWANINAEDKRPMAVSPLRLLIPETETTPDSEGSRVIARTPQEAVMRVHLDAPTPTQAGALKDGNGIVIGHYYHYSKDGFTETEIHTLGKYVSDEPRVAELTVVGVYRHLAEESKAILYDLGGALLMYEMSSTRLLINNSVISEAKQLNMANTLKGVNLKDHGFTQEDIVNADLPGVWVDANGNQISDEQAGNDPQAKFKADEIPKGSNVVRGWEGVKLVDKDGRESIAPVQIIRHQPSSSEEFRKSKNDTLDTLYFLARQYHRRISGDAVASGESRVQALGDFVASLAPTGQQYQDAVQWLLTTLLRLSAYLSGQTGRYDGLTVKCKPKYTAVQPTPEMLRILSDMHKDGQLDTETFLELSGISNDTDATLTRMQAEGLMDKQAEERIRLLLELLDKGVIQAEDVRKGAEALGVVLKPEVVSV